jgi:hypothetical protein
MLIPAAFSMISSVSRKVYVPIPDTDAQNR